MRSRAIQPSVVFTAITLAYLLLLSSQLIQAFAASGHDDALFMNLATEIISGRWLGHYNNLTLTKGLVYPLFIALGSAMGLPLLLFEHAFYAASCLIFVRAIHPLLRGVVAQYTLYTLLLFNPAAWSVLRVLREGIYPALTLCVIAGLFGLVLRRNASGWRVLPWSVGLGIALGAFWLTREEGAWILPAVVLTLGAILIFMWRERPTATRIDMFLLRRASLCIVPLAILGACNVGLAAVNKIEYGVFTTNEFKSKEFLAAYGALSRVDPAQWQQYIPVPEQARTDIYRVSPAFAELKPYLEGREHAWTKDGCIALPSTCGDFAGGWFMWALRDSVRDAGYYRSAPAAAHYYARLADEVNHACDTHALSCGPARQSLQPPWHRVYAAQLPPTLRRALQYVLQLSGVPTDYQPSNGTVQQLDEFRSVARNPVAPTAPRRSGFLQITGWAVTPQMDAPVDLRVIAPDGKEAQATYVPSASPDVHDLILRNDGKDLASASQARFTITTPCVTGCRLVALANGAELGGISLDSSRRALRTDTLEIFIDSLGATTPANAPIDVRVEDGKNAILNRITSVYRVLFPGLAVLGVIAMALAVVGFIRGRRSMLLFFIAMLGAEAVARLVLIALIDVTSFPVVFLPYLSPVYPLLLAFAGMSLLEAWYAYQEPAMRLLQAIRLKRLNLKRVSPE